ncbi:MAG TPA: UPF0158 family protein [Chitinophagales bacterium]|nr:UPF0158 family protein [Chitinophagales bacterium]
MIDKLFLDDIAFAFEDSAALWYIHKPTLEIVFLPGDDDTDESAEERDKIEENPHDYILIERLEPHIMFNLMEEFTEQVDKPGLKQQLQMVLSGKKPFANFRNTLNYYGDYLEEWYAFKNGFLDREAIRWLKENDLYEKAMNKKQGEME